MTLKYKASNKVCWSSQSPINPRFVVAGVWICSPCSGWKATRRCTNSQTAPADGGACTPAPDGALATPAGTVPVRVGNCFTVDISLSGGCGDA